jgi:hypothetical protein
MSEQKDGFNLDAYKSNLIGTQSKGPPLPQFQLGEAMIAQKKLGKHDNDLK